MDLSLATLDQIIEELATRYPNLVFAGIKAADGPTDDERDQIIILTRGSITMAVGLATRAVDILVHDSRPTEEEAEDDGEEE